MRMKESDVHEVARLMGTGGCDNRLIAQAVAQCARQVVSGQGLSPHAAERERLRIVEAVRAKGWFE